MPPLARILGFLSPFNRRSLPLSDHARADKDRALLQRALARRLSHHLRRDVGAGD